MARQKNLLARFASIDGSRTHVPRLSLAGRMQNVDSAPEIKAAHGWPTPSFFTCFRFRIPLKVLPISERPHLPLERAAKDKAKGTKSGRGTHPLPLLFGYCLENMAPLSEGVIGKGPSSPWLAGAHLIDKLLDSNHPCHKVLTEGRYAPLEVRSGHGCLKSMDHQQHGARPLARCHRSIFDHHRSWDDL